MVLQLAQLVLQVRLLLLQRAHRLQRHFLDCVDNKPKRRPSSFRGSVFFTIAFQGQYLFVEDGEILLVLLNGIRIGSGRMREALHGLLHQVDAAGAVVQAEVRRPGSAKVPPSFPLFPSAAAAVDLLPSRGGAVSIGRRLRLRAWCVCMC